MEKNAGYVIRESVLFDNKRGFAIAEHGNPKVPAPFVTWQFAEENGRRDYYWGHYHADEASAQKDFKDRAADYKRMYKVQEVKPRTIAQQMKEAAKLTGAALPRKRLPPTGATDRRIAMPEKYDPLKSAELTTEQNYNMIDGILNNGPAPVLPPEEKPLDKVREIPPKRRSREREER